MPPTICILICTMDERISQVPSMLLPPLSGVSYVVSHQRRQPIKIPNSLKKRNDVTIVGTRSRGLSANRNNALMHAIGELLVLADDDVTFSADYLRKLQRLAEAHPETDIFSLQALTPEGKRLHYYPRTHFTYPDIPRGFYFSSMGLVLRWGNFYPKFDTRFGLGSPRLHMCEEQVFLHQCHQMGFRIDYYPQPLLFTPGNTTSRHYADDPSLQQARGAMLTILHGKHKAKLRFLSTALKMHRQLPILSHLRNLYEGQKYILTHEPTP